MLRQCYTENRENFSTTTVLLVKKRKPIKEREEYDHENL